MEGLQAWRVGSPGCGVGREGRAVGLNRARRGCQPVSFPPDSRKLQERKKKKAGKEEGGGALVRSGEEWNWRSGRRNTLRSAHWSPAGPWPAQRPCLSPDLSALCVLPAELTQLPALRAPSLPRPGSPSHALYTSPQGQIPGTAASRPAKAWPAEASRGCERGLGAAGPRRLPRGSDVQGVTAQHPAPVLFPSP